MSDYDPQQLRSELKAAAAEVREALARYRARHPAKVGLPPAEAPAERPRDQAE